MVQSLEDCYYLYNKNGENAHTYEFNENKGWLQVITIPPPQPNKGFISTMTSSPEPSVLEPRFQCPESWQWQWLARDGYTLRYGFASLPDTRPKGVIIFLPGLSEFCEKYFELAHEALSRGYGFLVLDWHGQGLSSRYLKNPHKRHSKDFALECDDLAAVLEDCPLIEASTLLFMLAHSMGGHIGLRFLLNHPHNIKAAGFSAPMVGVHALASLNDKIASAATHALASLCSTCYAPMGGNWTAHTRELSSHAVFSQDPERAKIHNYWMLLNPALQVGHVTNQWLRDAHASCLQLRKDMVQRPLDIPCVFGVAGHENFVDSAAIRTLAHALPQADIIELSSARHEIFMELDLIRNQLLDPFYALLTRFG